MVNQDCFNMDHEQGKEVEEDEKAVTICICMNRSFAEVAGHFCQV